ncbi:hypothetical protein NQ314_006603 [Rhamnusium bicolor]|uniref:phospholipase A2 n=1 Tax=Rhamnusium bicolor TaxID=1586634 RepID=A0AAV8YZC9_9CUCU|nr:hypothetical protein NQ314_006603 [Rhamnusium bicolor]
MDSCDPVICQAVLSYNRFVVLRSFLNSEPLPNKVVEARPDTFSSRGIHFREDGLVLYLPQKVTQKGVKATYDIVLHRPTTETLHLIFSLYRTTDLEEAEVKFATFKDKLPIFIEVAKEMCNIHGLQKICDTLSEHPSWTLAHLAAHFALYDSFNDPRINCFLNSTDLDSGMSPLQVAITTQNLKTVQILVSANCSLEHLDYDGNSVFHYAASTTKEIVSVLSQGSPPRCLNARNKNGHTPLHMSCLADKPECVKALLLAGADVNIAATKADADNIVEPSYLGNFLQVHPNTFYLKDIKHGGTPLHWLECVVALLSRQANADLADKDGNRPIHLAVKGGNVSIVQALIIFGANLDILNNAGETARHLITEDQEPKILYYLYAVGAKRCSSNMEGCTDGCKFIGTYEGIPPPKILAAMDVASEKHKNKFPAKGRLLCLDGGGIKGLVLVQMLLELEKVFGKPINSCFDWLAGTSTGGILALGENNKLKVVNITRLTRALKSLTNISLIGIASGKTMKECLCLYFRLKEVTFVGKRPYSSESLENILKETFGTDTVMSDIKYPRVMVTGVLADRKPVELHLFRNYTSPNDILEVVHDSPYELPPPPEEQYVWEVGRATGAAPTYFR